MTGNAELLTRTLPADRLPEVRHRVELFARRCLKKGMPIPRLIEGEHSFIPDTTGIAPPCDPALLPQIEYVEVSLDAPDRVSLGGWSLLGRVDTLPDGSPLVARVPGTENTPLPLVSDPKACDHCGQPRTRTETFLVANDDGRLAQVGRDCLRDFLGHDPASLLWWAKALDRLDDDLNSFGAPAGSGEPIYATDAVLGLAARVAAHGGFLGRAKARQINAEIDDQGLLRRHTTPTADQVSWRLAPPRAFTRRERDEYDRKLAEWENRYPEDQSSADLLAATGQGIAALGDDPANEWEANVAQVVAQKHIRPRHLGTAVSAVVLGLRRQERAAPKAVSPSKHLGVIGDRLTLPATIVFTRQFPGDWGTRTLLKLQGDEGSLQWWATGIPLRPDSQQPWATGDAVTVSGRVKAHTVDRYDGRAVTDLTRCTLVPRQKPPRAPNPDEDLDLFASPEDIFGTELTTFA